MVLNKTTLQVSVSLSTNGPCKPWPQKTGTVSIGVNKTTVEVSIGVNKTTVQVSIGLKKTMVEVSNGLNKTTVQVSIGVIKTTVRVSTRLHTKVGGTVEKIRDHIMSEPDNGSGKL